MNHRRPFTLFLIKVEIFPSSCQLDRQEMDKLRYVGVLIVKTNKEEPINELRPIRLIQPIKPLVLLHDVCYHYYSLGIILRLHAFGFIDERLRVKALRWYM